MDGRRRVRKVFGSRCPLFLHLFLVGYRQSTRRRWCALRIFFQLCPVRGKEAYLCELMSTTSNLLHCWIRRPSSSMLQTQRNIQRKFRSFAADDRPIDELMDILAKPTSAVENFYRPGAPAPESIPMNYTSSSSSVSTYSATSPLSFSPLDNLPDYRVERKKRSPQRKGRGASLEPKTSPCE